MKLVEFNRQNLREIRESLQAKLNELSEEYGAEFKAGNISYTSESFTCKLEAIIVPDGMSKDQMEFNKYCSLFELTESDYGKTFTSNGETFTLIGLKPNRPKFPIIGMSRDGRRYKFTASALNKIKSVNKVTSKF